MRGLAALVLAALVPAAAAAELYPAPGGLELVLGPDKQDTILLPLGAAAQSETYKTASKIWGDAVRKDIAQECGAGPLDFADFENGLRIYFQDGVLVGWTTTFGEGPSLRNGFGIGSRVSEVADFAGPVEIEETTLGYEFWGDALYGFAAELSLDAQVEFYWSGLNCLFR